jgi:hypothetical protein
MWYIMFEALERCMRLVEMKLFWGLLWVKEMKPLKRVPMGIEAGIPMTHQPIVPLCKEYSGLLLEPMCHHSLEIFDPNIWPFSISFRRPNTWKSAVTGMGCVGGWSNTFQYMECSILESSGHMGRDGHYCATI